MNKSLVLDNKNRHNLTIFIIAIKKLEFKTMTKEQLKATKNINPNKEPSS